MHTHFTLAVSATVLLASAAFAQTASYTLPDGLTKTGGSYSSGNGVSYVFDRGAFHYQEVHGSWVGKGVKVLTKVGFRRAWNRATNTTAVARKGDFTFTCGYGVNSTFAKTSFSSNYTTGSAVEVFPKTTISMPSWTTKPSTSPAPFDVVIPFKKTFIYDGKREFIWELNYENPTVTTTTYYYCDRQSPSSAATDAGTVLGTGCVATGRTSAHTLNSTFYNYGAGGSPYTMRVYLYATNNPSSQPVTAAFGVTNPNAQLPGWCAKLYTLPLFYVPIGTSSSTGTLSSRYVDIPYIAGIVGVTTYGQAFAADPGQASGLSLTNAEALTMPKDPAGTPLSWKYVYQLSTSSTLSGPYTAGSVITGWN